MRILNRKFNREYEALTRYEAGIVLTGSEVKSVRSGALRLDGAYVKFIGGQPYLIGAEIPPYRFARHDDYDPKRSRKLLLKKQEILKIQTKIKGGNSLTVAPISCYNKGALIKLEVALARGLRSHEKAGLGKRAKIKRHEQREAKEHMKR